MIENKKVLLHTNQALLVRELLKRKVKVSLIDENMELLEARYGDHTELIADRFSSIIPFTIVNICADKRLTKYFLNKNDISVPEGELFYPDQKSQAVNYALKIGFPVVVKPNMGSHGDFVYSDLNSERELGDAVADFVKYCGDSTPFIIEKHFEGKEYRVFITSKGDLAIVHRDPASVIGDGANSILKLAKIESERRMSPRTTCLSPIVIDEVVKNTLTKQNTDLKYVPKMGEKVYLRKTTNVAKGGMCEDATDVIHSSVRQIARDIISIFKGMPYIGFDMLSKDITKEQTKDMYTILEVNSNPGFSLHMLPGKGSSRNVAKIAADYIFPETVTP